MRFFRDKKLEERVEALEQQYAKLKQEMKALRDGSVQKQVFIVAEKNSPLKEKVPVPNGEPLRQH